MNQQRDLLSIYIDKSGLPTVVSGDELERFLYSLIKKNWQSVFSECQTKSSIETLTYLTSNSVSRIEQSSVSTQNVKAIDSVRPKDAGHPLRLRVQPGLLQQ